MLSISEANIFNLVGQIYDTAQDNSPEAWLDIYEKMSNLLSSSAGSISLYSHEDKRYQLLATNFDMQLFDQYSEYYQHISPLHKRIVQMKAGETISRAEVLADKKFIKTEIYQEYFKLQNVFNYEYHVLTKDKNFSGGVSFARSEKMENFGKDELKAMRVIFPHLQRALQVNIKFFEVESDRQIFLDCLEKITQGIIVLDNTRKIIFLNSSANKIIAKKDGLQIGREGKLLTNLPTETKKLQILLNGVFAPNINQTAGFGGLLQISRQQSLRPLSVLVSPFSKQNIANFPSKIFALLFVNDPEQKVETDEVALQQMYNLTTAESKIAAILAQGVSLKDGSEILGIKVSTIRTHLKRIFSKTETNRQSELVKLILSNPVILNNSKKTEYEL